jgi:ABC-2 type transport system ATP-binding protein
MAVETRTDARPPPAPAADSSAEPGAIELTALTKSYGDVRALDGIDLSVGRGEIFGFLGPNGAGKTTAIRILLDLIRPDSGRALILGLDAQRDGVAVRRRTGYLPSERHLYENMTAADLFAYVDRVRGGTVDRGYVRSLTERLELDADRRIGSLSSGNRQKVGVVQALMARPEVAILDEPTLGLDPLMQEIVEEILRETAADGRTVFFSSHILAEVEELCDRAAILRAGRVVDVFDLAEQQRLAPRRVDVTFRAPPPPAAFGGIDGVSVLSTGDRSATLEVRDGFDELIKCLARLEVDHLESRQPTLDELFLSYYEEPEEPEEPEERPTSVEAAS